MPVSIKPNIDETQLKKDIWTILGYITVQDQQYPLSKKQYDAKRRLRKYVMNDIVNGGFRMTEKIYRVRCVDGKLYLVHHGVSDYIGLDDQSTNEKAIIQISHYLNEQEERIKELEKESQYWKSTSGCHASECDVLTMKLRFAEERNNQQYELLEKITELIRKQDWETLTESVTVPNKIFELLAKEFQALGVKPCDTQN